MGRRFSEKLRGSVRAALKKRRAGTILNSNVQCAPVAQLDRASASGVEGRAFESRRVYHFYLKTALSDPSRRPLICPCPKHGLRQIYGTFFGKTSVAFQRVMRRVTKTMRNRDQINFAKRRRPYRPGTRNLSGFCTSCRKFLWTFGAELFSRIPDGIAFKQEGRIIVPGAISFFIPSFGA